MQTLKHSFGSYSFYSNLLKGSSQQLFIFIPGFMESKAGLYYFWSQLAKKLHSLGHSSIQFDLAGQGDSVLPLSISLWKKQIDCLRNEFESSSLTFISRGSGAIALPEVSKCVAIAPAFEDPTSDLLKSIRWKTSPANSEYLTPAFPNQLLQNEIDCFHQLGAEAGCIGGLEISNHFLEELCTALPKKLPSNVLQYFLEDNTEPLFEKWIDREKLFTQILKDLGIE